MQNFFWSEMERGKKRNEVELLKWNECWWIKCECAALAEFCVHMTIIIYAHTIKYVCRVEKAVVVAIFCVYFWCKQESIGEKEIFEYWRMLCGFCPYLPPPNIKSIFPLANMSTSLSGVVSFSSLALRPFPSCLILLFREIENFVCGFKLDSLLLIFNIVKQKYNMRHEKRRHVWSKKNLENMGNMGMHVCWYIKCV